MLPNLATPRLVLRAATDADLDALWHLLTDPQVRRYLCDDRELTRVQVEELLAESMAQWPAGMGLWLLCDPTTTGPCHPLRTYRLTPAGFDRRAAGQRGGS